jgi:DNA primase
MSDTVQQVKDRLSIVEVVGGYVKLERAGQNMRARCPFHNERSPSFMVSPERGSYHCFGCGVGGDIFTFVQAIEGLDFKGALKVLADRAGVPIEFGTWRSDKGEDEARDRLFALMEASALWYTTQLTPEARAYLGTRGMTEDTITAFRIGWAGSGWDVPIFDSFHIIHNLNI